MAEPSTVARPYAEAAFKLPDEKGELARWSGMLAALVQLGVRHELANILALATSTQVNFLLSAIVIWPDRPTSWPCSGKAATGNGLRCITATCITSS